MNCGAASYPGRRSASSATITVELMVRGEDWSLAVERGVSPAVVLARPSAADHNPGLLNDSI